MDRNIEDNGCQIFTLPTHFLALAQQLLLLWFERIEMSQDIFQVAIFLQETRGRFLANARHTGNIIGFITHQTLKIGQSTRGKAIAGLDFRLTVFSDLRNAPLGNLYQYMIVYQLERVHIASINYDGINPLLYC